MQKTALEDSVRLTNAGINYSASVARLTHVLIEGVSVLSKYQNDNFTTTVFLGDYLWLIEIRNELTPTKFHDGLWEKIDDARSDLKELPELLMHLNAVHDLLVRNSRTPEVMKGKDFEAGSIDDMAKVYYGDKEKKLKRASIGLSRKGDFLWESSCILVAMVKGTEATAHIHPKTLETGMSFARGTKSYREVDTLSERIEHTEPGTWTLVPPGEKHRVDSSENISATPCFGFSVAFPGAALDRAANISKQEDVPNFSHASVRYGEKSNQVAMHYLFQEGEGSYLQPHVTLQPSKKLVVGAFPERAPGTIVATLLVGGDFLVKTRTSERMIVGEGVVLSDGVPFECECLRAISNEIPMQAGLTIALPCIEDPSIIRRNSLQENLRVI